MKKLITLVMMAVVSFSSLQTQAQAFDKGKAMLTLSIGAADMFHIPVGYNSYLNSFYTPTTGQIAVQGEWGIHRYVGIGFTAGIGGRAGGVVGLAGVYSGWYPEFNIPVGFIANFHFYQLIGDKVKKDIHSDKLDIYAGLSIGTGIAIHPGGYYDANYNYRTGAFNDVLFFFGPQVGVRYWFTDKIAINGEFGFGKTLASAGVSFNLGGGKGGSAKSSKKK